jgi:hypothetical protein
MLLDLLLINYVVRQMFVSPFRSQQYVSRSPEEHLQYNYHSDVKPITFGNTTNSQAKENFLTWQRALVRSTKGNGHVLCAWNIKMFVFIDTDTMRE